MKASPRTSVVLIPSFRPDSRLVELISELVRGDTTVVVVNDGSGEDYNPIFDSLAGSATVLRHDHNKGKGAALKTGIAYIADNFENYIIATADGDGQHHVDDILRLVRTYPTLAGSLLLGVRDFSDASVPWRSRIGNTITRRLFRLITKLDIQDTQTGLRAFDSTLTELLLSVPGDGFEYETNVLLESATRNIPINELSIATIYSEHNSSSHFKPVRDSFRIYAQIMKYIIHR